MADSGDGTPTYRLFALSLAGIKQEVEDSLFDHLASFAIARDETEAHAEGIKEARQQWPEDEGWELSVSSAEIRPDPSLEEHETDRG